MKWSLPHVLKDLGIDFFPSRQIHSFQNVFRVYFDIVFQSFSKITKCSFVHLGFYDIIFCVSFFIRFYNVYLIVLPLFPVTVLYYFRNLCGTGVNTSRTGSEKICRT